MKYKEKSCEVCSWYGTCDYNNNIPDGKKGFCSKFEEENSKKEHP